MVNTAADAYKRQQVMTATPEALTLMLYNGCLKFIKEGVEALAEKHYETANESIQKAQNIISEFRVTSTWIMRSPISSCRFITTPTTVSSRGI